MTIHNAEYYESNKATASNAHGDLIRNPEPVTHTSNGNETFTHTRNRNFAKILSNQTIPVVVSEMNPRIDQRIVPIVLAPHTLLVTETKEVVADAASGGA